MMKSWPPLIPIVLLCVLSGPLVAQDANKQSESVLELVANLDQGIAQIQILDQQIELVGDLGREALIFRHDERRFNLLADLDALVRVAAELPPEDPARLQVEQRLREELVGLGEAVFTRIENVGQRIEEHSGQLESLSGSQRIASEAYINTMEQIRFKYYEALQDFIEGRELFDVPSEELRKALQQQLYLHGETLAGLAEFTGRALSEVQEKQQTDPDNADLTASVIALANQQQLLLGRLDIMVGVMERLGTDTSSYKSILIEQGDRLSLRVLETDVLMDLVREGWTSLRESLVKQAPDILLRLLALVLVLLAFRALSKLTRRAVSAACERPHIEMSALLKNVLVSISGGTVMAIGILMALSQIGISLGPMLAGLGVAGFVVGFALQDTLGNFAAGSMILIYRPYDVDDFIEVAGAAGLVKKMSLVSTTIATFDNQILVVPNSKIWGDVIKNVTAQKLRRVDLEFGIGYGDDVAQAERVFHDVLSEHEKVLDNPEPMIKLSSLGDSSVNFVVRPWVRTEDYWDVYFDLMREVKLRLDSEGISIPFPQRDVHIHQQEG